ncbi:hypothetical protein PR001_g7369 [Phytophthora rubi]|uniref:Uncharacterized protein n=1 Tax=Phytophthora rubi TaxID=129364 RepID=A0A6A3N695_9STRA|nr:hypothetical protein PR001_g7369 [Phytophthora rubi]
MADSDAVDEESPAMPFSGVTGDLNPRTPVVQTPSQLPTRLSPRYTTPMSQRSSRQNTPAAPVIPPNVEQTIDEDDVDDIGDGVDAEETFPHWVEYLDGVFDDDEIGSAFAASEDNTYLNWELEEIPAANDTVFPDTDDGSFPQENKIVGIRALKASLSALYASNSSRRAITNWSATLEMNCALAVAIGVEKKKASATPPPTLTRPGTPNVVCLSTINPNVNGGSHSTGSPQRENGAATAPAAH